MAWGKINWESCATCTQNEDSPPSRFKISWIQIDGMKSESFCDYSHYYGSRSNWETQAIVLTTFQNNLIDLLLIVCQKESWCSAAMRSWDRFWRGRMLMWELVTQNWISIVERIFPFLLLILFFLRLLNIFIRCYLASSRRGHKNVINCGIALKPAIDK